MAQSTGRGARVVGDYLVGKQIGSGSFSVVWHARHRVHGTEVAIKEIAMGRLSKKLQESLMSEIFILKQINHPNIIRLHEIIEAPGMIHLVLEFCKGGDLSVYIHRHERVPEVTAKYFMQQLAAGLQVLRDNNLIHRDLKPQNLLLSSTDDNAVLKIADFGFARSLQPMGLAETLCGSPLYMAPEIMQAQKYDAKADLWSVGTILFQLVTGKTPYTGNNQFQLLQNIIKSTELLFPLDCEELSSECKDLCRKLLRRNPVERLTFEEFFRHPFLSQSQVQSNDPLRMLDSLSLSDREHERSTEESSQEDCFPFFLDDDSSGPSGSPSSLRKSAMKATYGFSVDATNDRKKTAFGATTKTDVASRYRSAAYNQENSRQRHENHGPLGNVDESHKLLDRRSVNYRSKVQDPLECSDQDYVLVAGPPTDVSSSTANALRTRNPLFRAASPQASTNIKMKPSAPVPIAGGASIHMHYTGNLEGPSSAPGTSVGSTDIRDAIEQPSSHCMTRIVSLQHCASAIKELVNEKIEAGKPLEAFSIQLVILAIWKQALHICHTQAASAMEGSPSQQNAGLRRGMGKAHVDPDRGGQEVICSQGTEDMSSQIEGEFLREVEHAEELAKAIEPGNTEIPDAMETIFQSALALGRRGGVDELMGNMEAAALSYSKAVQLLLFLLVEAPSLILNPPFSLTNSDRYRLRRYIDIINNRQDYSRSQRMVLLKSDYQPSPP